MLCRKFDLVPIKIGFFTNFTNFIYLLLLSFSYMYAVAMARNLEVQVENKLVRQYRVQEYVPATAREVQSAYSKLMEVCTISKY